MPEDCITIELELPELRVIGQLECADHHEIRVEYLSDIQECPRCHRPTNKVHSQREQPKRDISLRDKPVWLVLRKRRFRCLSCGRVFSEADTVFGSRRRSSQRFRQCLARQSVHLALRQVARQEQVSEGLVRRSFAEEIGDKIGVSGRIENTPVYLGVDEFAVKKGRLYHTAICDLSARQVMGVEPGHTGQSLSAFLDRLSELEKVKAVVMDTRAWSQALGTGMHEPYRQAVGMCCPNAVVIADKFHVVRKVNEALDKRRVVEQGQKKTGKRKLFQSRYLLLKAREKLTPEELPRIEALLDIYPALKVAWELKEKFRDIYLALNRSEAESQLKQWVNEVRACALPEFIGLLSIVRNWGLEMLNYFDYRLTNGYVEGKNNRIKVLKRIAYGYRDIKVFVERIFLTNEPISNPRALKFSYHTY